MAQNIYKKMSLITNELSTVAKNLEVGYGKSSYKAVGEADVLKAIKPLEEKYGIYSFPYEREIVDTGVIESIDSNGNSRKQFFERIKTTYRFVNIDEINEFIDITSYGDGLDSGDKSVGKAMTYADKYALMKAYKIITGDDPDQQQSEDLVSYKKTEKKASEKQIKILLDTYKDDNLTKLLKVNNIEKIEDISMEKASEIIKKLVASKKAKESEENS